MGGSQRPARLQSETGKPEAAVRLTPQERARTCALLYLLRNFTCTVRTAAGRLWIYKPTWVKRRACILISLAILVPSILACVGSASPTAYPTYTPYPTHTPLPEPTDAPRPTSTPKPTRTPTPISTPIPTDTPTPTPARTEARVIKVVDGDTISVDIDGESYSLRYIGIDCPESNEWMSTEATQANRDLVGGKTIYLEIDVSETDRYDRLLRYVFLADGTFVNAELVRLGHARARAYPPDTKHQELLEEMQQEAKAAGRGIWGPTPTPPPTNTPVPAAPTGAPTLTPPAAVVPTLTPPAAAVPTNTPPAAAYDCSSNAHNCADSGTHAAAQDGC